MTISAIRPVYLSSIYRTDLTSLEEARRIKIAGYYRQWMLAPKMAMFSGCVSGVFLVCWLLVQVFSHEDKPRGDPPFRTTWGVMGKEEVDQTIYRPAFYWLRENDVIPAVEYYDLMNCTMVFAEWLNRAQNYKMSQPSPSKLPKILKNQFTLNGLLQWTSQPDDSRFDKSHVVWTRDQIEDLVLKDVVEFNELDGQARAMYRAMENNDINGNKILVFGTERTPWIESFALKEGALEVLRTGPVNITVENYPYVQYKNPMDIARKYHKYLDYFDVAASFSLESYGFGRFDPLNPNGDLLEIQKTYCMLKDKGILLLGLPIGWDNVVWNKKRIYGRLRLGMVAAAFDVIDMYYYEETIPIVVEEFDKTSKASSSISKRVVLVLKKRHSTTGRF